MSWSQDVLYLEVSLYMYAILNDRKIMLIFVTEMQYDCP